MYCIWISRNHSISATHQDIEQSRSAQDEWLYISMGREELTETRIGVNRSSLDWQLVTGGCSWLSTKVSMYIGNLDGEVGNMGLSIWKEE